LIASRSSIWLVFTVILLIVRPVFAGEPMSLDKAMHYALANNPSLSVSQQQVSAAYEQSLSMSRAADPVVSLSYGARVSNNPLDAFADKLFTQKITTDDFVPSKLNNPDSSELFVTSLSTRWPVYSGGKIIAQQLQTKVQLQQRQLLYQRAQQQIVFDTMKAYLYVVATKKALLISHEAEQAFQRHATSTAKLAKQGRAVESDKLSAQVNLSAIKVQTVQAQTRYKHAISKLKNVMGMPISDSLSISADWPVVPNGQKNIEVLIQQAQQQRVDLLAAVQSVAAAKASIDIAKANNKLNINFVASSNWYDDDFGFDSQSYSIMAVASLNLYDGATDGKLGAARAQYKGEQWRKQVLQQAVDLDVKLALDNLLEAETRIGIAKNNIVIAKKTVRLVKKRYGRGLTILLDLLQSERMYIDARLEVLTSELNLRTSRLSLLNAVGVLDVPKEML